jgi:hypothetical protein
MSITYASLVIRYAVPAVRPISPPARVPSLAADGRASVTGVDSHRGAVPGGSELAAATSNGTAGEHAGAGIG